MTTMVYMEGGAPGRMARDLRNAARSFLERAGVARESFQVTACGSGADAYDKFGEAVQKGRAAFLLADAEEPVTASGPWEHLGQRGENRWSRPSGSTDEQCHLMVQVMESWFLADPDALATYYGQGFHRQALPRNPLVEQVPKDDVLNGLNRAASGTKKGDYRKQRDSSKILEAIDPMKVRNASPYADRLLKAF